MKSIDFFVDWLSMTTLPVFCGADDAPHALQYAKTYLVRGSPFGKKRLPSHLARRAS